MKVKGNKASEGCAKVGANPRKAGKAKPKAELTLIRGSTLATLYARGALSDRQMKAAVALREKVRAMTGGMPAQNWMREKVDGGRMVLGPAGGLTSALDADRQVREALKASGMGLIAAEVVLRVAGFDEALKLVALDFEDGIERQDLARREKLEPTRDALGYTRKQLRDGLTALADHWFGAERRRDSLLGNALYSWLTVDRAR